MINSLKFLVSGPYEAFTEERKQSIKIATIVKKIVARKSRSIRNRVIAEERKKAIKIKVGGGYELENCLFGVPEKKKRLEADRIFEK